MIATTRSDIHITQYMGAKPTHSIKKKHTFLALARGSILPKTGKTETVAANFDEYLYASK